MRKRLVILGLLLAIAPMVTSQPNQAPNGKQKTAKQVKTEGNTVSADKIDNQTNGEANQTKPSSDPPGGNAPVERPHWWTIPDWWLVIVAALTGGVICWQSIQTKKAARSAERQITLQSMAMRQWVNIEPVGTVTPRTFEDSFEVTIQFAVRNRTDYLLTIKKIVTEVFTNGKATIFTASCDEPVPPEKSGAVGGHPFFMRANVSRYTWDTDGHPFLIGGDVTFMDCMGVEQNQTFHGFFHGYADGRLVEKRPSGLVPEVADYKPEDEQTQNPK